jgi:4-aminobutyrate aminotransferase-like enzyme
MSETGNEAVEAAVRACQMLRQAERLLAAAGFYKTASDVRASREDTEDCTTESVRKLRPSVKDYSPQTIGNLVSEREASPAERPA